MTFLPDCTIRVSAILIAALITLGLLRKQSAATRHWVLSAATLLASIAPVLSFVMPSWNPNVYPAIQALPRFSAPEEQPNALSGVIAVTAKESTGSSVISAAPALPEQLPETIWLAGVALGFVVLITGSVRLARIAAGSQSVAGGRWTRLAGMISREYGLRRTVRLLQSRNPSRYWSHGVFCGPR